MPDAVRRRVARAGRALLVAAVVALALVAPADLVGAGPLAREAGTIAWAAAFGGALCCLVSGHGVERARH